MGVLRRNRVTYFATALMLALHTGGGLQRNQRSCHLRGLPHDTACQGALRDK